MPIMNTIISGGGQTPTGTKSITENGLYNVAAFANADVQVSSSGPDVYIPRGLITSGSEITFGINGITESAVSTKTATKVGKYAFAYAFYTNENISLPNITLTNVTTVDEYAFFHAFDHSGTVPATSVFSAPNLTTVGTYGFSYAFNGYSVFPTFDFSSVTSVGDYAFQYAFGKGVTSIDFSGLTTVGQSAFNNAHRSGFDLATFKFDSLATLDGASSVFNYCLAWTSSEYTHTVNLDISFPALTTINNSSNCFAYFAQHNKNIHSFSFPELTSITSSSSVFNYALSGSYYNGVSPVKQAAVSFPKLKTIKNSSNAFSCLCGSSNISTSSDGVDFSNLEIIYNSANCFNHAFERVGSLDTGGVLNMFPKLRAISTNGNYDQGVFNYSFNSNTGTTSVIFPELLIVTGSALQSSYNHFNYTFSGANSLVKLEFPKIKIIDHALYSFCGGASFRQIIFGENVYSLGRYGLMVVFANKTGVDLTIPAVSINGDNSILQLGLSSSTIRFPVLVRIDTASIYQMLATGSNNTVHFPIRMQSTIEAINGYPNFAGTSTTVLFDIVYKVNDGTTDYVRFHDGYNNTSYVYQRDYIVGADGVTYYRDPSATASWATESGKVYTKWIDENDNVVSTISFNPTVGEDVYVNTTSTVKTTVDSYVPNRVYVPNTAEPQVGDTLYSDAACTTSAGTISIIE